MTSSLDAARPGTRIIGLLLGVAWSSWCTAPATPPFPGPTVQPQTRRFEDTSARRPSRRGPTPRIVARRPLRRSLSSRRGAILKAQRQGRRCLLSAFPSRSLRPLDFRKIKTFPAENCEGDPSTRVPAAGGRGRARVPLVPARPPGRASGRAKGERRGALGG